MTTETEAVQADYLELTANIVSAYVAANKVAPGELVSMIASVDGALRGLGKSAQQQPVELVPAVSVKKSITPDFIICLEDGRKFKSLKRHLRTAYGLSPEEYRAKWNLSADYPMVAPNYAQARAELARSIGLGKKQKRPSAKGKPKTNKA